MTSASPHIEIVSFPVEGMTCASCVNRITRSVTVVSNALRLRRFQARRSIVGIRHQPVTAPSVT